MLGCRLPIRVEQAAHKGLFLDKFLPQKPEARASGSLDPQAEALRALSSCRFDSVIYKLAFARWKDQWKNKGDSVLCLEGKVRDRMAIGLGAASVLGNGVRLHHTYGTPVIPGSSVKGVLRRGIPTEHRNVYSVTDKRNVEWFLFGSEDWAGAVRFQDAWWVPDANAALALDVVTPHHQKYQAGRGAPTDFDQPVPVPFLGVRGRFLFVVEVPSVAWRVYMAALIKATLREQGIGAKRSTGYGVIDAEA
jgi:CRISPR-associated protein Cmr6